METNAVGLSGLNDRITDLRAMRNAALVWCKTS
jgi:hypothetical protein